ncbi:MAG TPA: molybdate ABC transporter permease subunit [Dehalococcoidia bacterium]|nr:molybdate ABC transporter permease subunit [Dehalococcoidia bacterium]
MDPGAIDLSDLRLTLQVSFGATLLCVAIGLPIAWLLARHEFRGKAIVEALTTLPLVLPPTVVGFYLLRAAGRSSPVGRFLEDEIGVRLVFTWEGAAIAAAVLSAPLLIRSAQAGFAEVDPELERVAATLGRTPLGVFFTITLPLAIRGVAAGVGLAFARAAGEFGATVMVAGNIPGRTRTMSVAVYDAVQAGDFERANATALVLILMSVASLAVFSWLTFLVRRA